MARLIEQFQPAMIELNQITKSYGVGDKQQMVLKQVSLNISEGSLTAIVGASGSGKSTLMNLIGLLDKSDSGEYLLQGNSVAGLSADALAQLRNHLIGFVFQQFNLLPRFNVLQNVALPLTYRQTTPKFIEQKVKEALSRVGMETYLLRYPNQLSGGQQQRVAIARALVTEPAILLADEPTGSLDSKTGRDIMDLFLSLHQEGKTVILVTHDERIASQCSRQIVLHDGRILREQTHEVA